MNHEPIVVECPECSRLFDCVVEGKTRMGECLCSLDCADAAFPDFKNAMKTFIVTYPDGTFAGGTTRVRYSDAAH